MTKTPEHDKADTATIEKLKILKDILSASVPVDDQPGYGEYNKYQPAFEPHERDELKKKIMELVKSL